MVQPISTAHSWSRTSGVAASVASWAVILYKMWIFKRAERQTAQFVDVFRRSNKFSEVQAVCGGGGSTCGDAFEFRKEAARGVEGEESFPVGPRLVPTGLRIR